MAELPFAADKWCLTAVVLYNYLYVIGGYRRCVKRGWEFKMASFRFNPLTVTWTATAPLIKVGSPPASAGGPLQVTQKQWCTVATDGGAFTDSRPVTLIQVANGRFHRS